MKSQRALGVTPRRPLTPADEVAWDEVSTFDDRDRAARIARRRRLGDYIAELEMPDEMEHSHDPETGHRGWRLTRPDDLLRRVRNVWAVLG
jgi:hypothetical protein